MLCAGNFLFLRMCQRLQSFASSQQDSMASVPAPFLSRLKCQMLCSQAMQCDPKPCFAAMALQ